MDCVTTRLQMEIGMLFQSLTLKNVMMMMIFCENWRNSLWRSVNRENI